MKIKPKINTSPGHCANLVLAAGATVSNLYEAHGLEGFGSAAGRAAFKLVCRIDKSITA